MPIQGKSNVQLKNIIVHFQDGIETIDAAYEVFIQEGFEDFQYFAFQLKTTAVKSFASKRIEEYLRIIHARGGTAMCQEVLEYIVLVLGKYLQMMVAFHIFKGDLEKVILQFKHFNTLHSGICEVFLAVTNDPFHPGALRKQKAEARPMLRENLLALKVSDAASLELGQFLRSNKLTELGELFTRSGMTLEDVLTLNDQEMTDLGIGKYRLRKILLTAIRNPHTEHINC